MEPLASVDDVLNRYPGTLRPESKARIPYLLTDASVTVRSYCKQTFTAQTSTHRIRPIGDTVRLRQQPVVSVTSVGLVDTLTTSGVISLPLGSWVWDGGQEIWIGAIGRVINLPEEAFALLRRHTPLIEVVYGHGYATSPDDVVTVVCSMVLRVLDLPGPTSMTSNQVGPVAYSTSAEAREGILALNDAEKRILGQYRPSGTTVELR